MTQSEHQLLLGERKPEPEYLAVEEVAATLGITVWRARQLIAKRGIAVRGSRRDPFILQSDIAELVSVADGNGQPDGM